MSMKPPFLKRIYNHKEIESHDDYYPFSTKILKKGLDVSFSKPITILAGENGSGKSTLLEIIALHCGFNLSGGSKNHNYTEQEADISPALEKLRFSWKKKISNGFFMRAESFVNFASYIDEMAKDDARIYRGYGGNSLHRKSHGEAFLSLFENRLIQNGLFILDEPEAALSPERQLALLAILKEVADTGNSQVIIATHSPLLMAIPDAELFSIEEGEFLAKNYKETLHFQIMARFMSNPDDYINKFIGINPTRRT